MGADDHLSARETFVGDGPGRLYVRDVGRGPAVIVVHGGPDFDHEYLLPQMDRLADSLRLIYYDQRGRGRSAAGVEPEDVTIRSEITDLDSVRSWCGLPSVAVLGHSWGGVVAMEYAIRHPDRVSHLILMNTAPASRADVLVMQDELARRKSPEQAEAMVAITSTSEYQDGDLDAEAEYYRIHFGSTLPNPEVLEQVIRSLRAAFTPEGIVLARAIEHRLYDETWTRDDFDLLPALAQLRIPTLVIHGGNDLIPVEVARRIASAIPNSRFVVLEHCGHFSYLEDPERVGGIVTDFLASP